MKKFFIVPLLASVLLLQSCSTSVLQIALAAIATGTDAVVQSLALGGQIDPSLVPVITGITNSIITATQETATELASSDTSAVKASKINADWAGVLTSIAGLPPNAKSIVSVISIDINAFLGIISPAQPLASGGVVSHGIIVPAQIHMGLMDRYRLHRLQDKLESMKKTLADIKAK